MRNFSSLSLNSNSEFNFHYLWSFKRYSLKIITKWIKNQLKTNNCQANFRSKDLNNMMNFITVQSQEEIVEGCRFLLNKREGVRTLKYRKKPLRQNYFKNPRKPNLTTHQSILTSRNTSKVPLSPFFYPLTILEPPPPWG